MGDCCNQHQHSIRLSKGTTKAHRRFAALYNRRVGAFFRATYSWLRLMRKAIVYGIDTQLIGGAKPDLASMESLVPWRPKSRLSKRIVEVAADQLYERLIDVVKAHNFTDVTASLADWNCIRNKGANKMGPHHLRIYGKASGIAGQLARVSATWDVVNQRAVEWAAKHSNQMVTAITDETRQYLRSIVSNGIKEGQSIPTIARQMRPKTGLNMRQGIALDRFEDKLRAKYAKMPRGITPARRIKIRSAVQREANKKLRYRAEMISRTETARSMSSGTVETYREAEVKRIRFDASGDACEVCSGYDGNTYTLANGEGLIPVHPNCITCSRTKILTTKGRKSIKDVKVGDLVFTHRNNLRPVTHLHRLQASKANVVMLHFMQGKFLELTEDHPIIINGKWAHVSSVLPGDLVKGTFGQVKITSVAKYVKDHADLYNLSVAEDESYIAEGIAVANCRCSWTPVAAKERARVKEPKPEPKPELKPTVQAEGKWADRHFKLRDREGIKGWENSLKQNEKDTFRGWGGGDYVDIRAIDSGKIKGTASMRQKHKTLKNTITNAPKIDGTIYRGLRDLPPEDMKNITTVGNEFKLKAVSSFSANKKVAENFAGWGNSVVLRVQTKSAIDLRGVCSRVEKELLIDKGHRYKIMKFEETVGPTKRTKRVVWLKEIE